MNKDLKTNWLKELRSGKYNQGKLFLKYQRNNAIYYDPLGILCELEDLKESQRIINSFTVYEFTYKNDTRHYNLPGPFALKHNLQSIQFSIHQLNDHLRMPFPEIADYLEQHLK